MELTSISPTRTLMSALQSIRPSNSGGTDADLSVEHRQQSYSDSRTERGSMMIMQQTRTMQYTSLRVQLAAPEQGSSTKGYQDKDYRAQLQAGLEKLIADHQRPLQDLLDSPLLSDSQILSVEYFSLTLVQITTVVVQQNPLPSMASLVEMLRDQLARLMKDLFPGYGDSFNLGTFPASPEVLPRDKGSGDNATGEASAQSETAPDAPRAKDTPPAAVAQAENAVTSATQEPQDTFGSTPLFRLVQRFTVVFSSSVHSFQDRMQSIQGNPSRSLNPDSLRGVFSRNIARLRDLALYRALDDQPVPEGAVSREA